MTEIELWSRLKKIERARTALLKNGFDAVVVQTKDEAAELVMSYIQPGMKLGFGGSMTIKSLGIPGKAKEAGAVILDHNRPGITPEERLMVLRAQLTCDLFLCSSNAVTLKGELFNIDGNGNRVAAMTFGPKRNIVVAGANKIVADEAEAWKRLQSTAAPMNNKRLQKDNPCVKSGYCMDCDSPGRICRVYQIMRRKPLLSDFTVILVAEDLGF
ncbi:MAG: lactate utilization protein [Spirochaetes bacterium]|nr:lactate utilization protein [Spirochaetota bacterium]